ncbi:hypothetical protein R69927_07603 [Paraburkholderia domus]|jgi:hypothetical protein|uniref:hypothetical protein n=1 Tax=Paraburkholderia domus TaxID=2793075 RepID=UPI0019120532|nr:hypothetical protein [Paraburkholderia domus]MBK5050835.1 hypothetical protein [Burkholderia sp. R-70006]MBK5060974.1 hypothetical protein [Burkholderia sp. R-70199]MBK5091644.1 hypothetical protein [Burkholderia sp. R-69927]MBK5124779.1 hypothetical protein [Burkholderia sp. R-69980]MBK5179402.1 hypothetical protein [Burkholderia sp. R-69749]MCI0146339.1 hypothetical protein [Paraburkholderia sediminicola]
MKVRFIDNGNLASWLRLTLIVIGIGLAAVALACELPVFLARAFLLVGFFSVLVGGMTSRAKLLNIKPFDNSYKRARDSYKSKDDGSGK